MISLPKISIITPSYNYARYIDKTIQSVIDQNYPNWEHIIVDDGSTDNSVEVIKKYLINYPDKIKLIQQKNAGQSSALNKGFKMATGDIIGWLNADDLYLPDTFNTVAKSLSIDTTDAVYGNVKFIDASGYVTRELITQHSRKWMSLFYCFIPSNTFFFKRKIIDSGLLIDKSFHIAMDKEFFAHIIYSGFNIKKVDYFFAKFRWHADNKSIDTPTTKKIRIHEGLKIFNRYSMFYLPDNLISINVYILLMNFSVFYRLCCRYFKVDIYKFT